MVSDELDQKMMIASREVNDLVASKTVLLGRNDARALIECVIEELGALLEGIPEEET